MTRLVRTALIGAALLAPVQGAAQTTPPPTSLDAAPATQWQPALYLLGTSERGSGAAYAPPLDELRRDDALSVALGLDVRHRLEHGRLEASAFGLAHDPAAAGDRGFFLAARARATHSWDEGAWVLRVEDSPRVQRRESVSVSQFQRNELWVELERRTQGPTVGLRVSDRRRSVRDASLQGFARQWISATLAGGSPTAATWRLEAGPQHFSTDVARGWRFASAAELAGAVLRARMALRLLWIEPSSRGRTGDLAASPATPGPSPTPTPLPPGVERASVLDTVAPVASPQFSPPPAQLVGPVLAVDPLDSDEADWDFGRRKLEARLVASRSVPGEVFASVELRAQRERGPDVTVVGPEVHVRRDRLAVRASLRREIGSRVALLAEGSWQRVRDSRPGFPYSRTIVAFGLELRP